MSYPPSNAPVHRDRDYHQRSDNQYQEISLEIPRRQLKSYKETNPPSDAIILKNIPVSITEDTVSDCLKVFGAVEEVKRLFDEMGRPENAVTAHFESVKMASTIFSSIMSLKVPFKIENITPQISYYYAPNNVKNDSKKIMSSDTEKNKRSYFEQQGDPSFRPRSSHLPHNHNSSIIETRNDTRTETDPEIEPSNNDDIPEWSFQLIVRGLPFDFLNNGELESFFAFHLLHIQNHSSVISRVDVGTLPNGMCSGFATLTFKSPSFVSEILNKTQGQVIFKGHHLALIQKAPASNSTEQESKLIPDDPEEFRALAKRLIEQQKQNETSEQTDAFITRVQNPPNSHPYHEYIYDQRIGYIQDVQSQLFWDQYYGWFFDWNGNFFYYDPVSQQYIPYENNKKSENIQGNMEHNNVNSGNNSDSSRAPQNPESQLEQSQQKENPQPTETSSGTISFTLKSAISKPKATASIVTSKLSSNLPSSNLSESSNNSAHSSTPQQSIPSRGARHFVNIPNPSVVPARSTASNATSSNKQPVQKESDPPAVSAPALTKGTICLLCKRQLGSMELLERHLRESELHKSKLAELAANNENAKKRPRQESPDAELTLDDNLPSFNEKKPDRPTDPSSSSSASDSAATSFSSGIGMKLMQKMGYSGGKLGKN